MGREDDERRDKLIAEAETLGYQVLRNSTWGDILWRPGHPIKPQTHSNANLDDLEEMIEGIKWGREHGTAEK